MTTTRVIHARLIDGTGADPVERWRTSTGSWSAQADLIGPDQSQYGMELGLVAEEVGARRAIVTTTRDNARVLRVADETGTVEAGKAADLIAVAADPLADPAALADPGTVTLVLQGGAVRKDLR